MREKLGRNDPCPCGSTRRFQELLHAPRPTRRRRARLLFSASRRAARQRGSMNLVAAPRE
ncbi:MAG: SEC-C metal-binding domain-containing protein [Chthoniobacter sp.]|uniref:SEC-C metal-binding domain-containing protein n=1 Tax=Chthoniobacter sp. TaxID=2510640 RepID=UPI0032AA7994